MAPGRSLKRSAGLLVVRRRSGGLEALIAHPGGPFFLRKQAGAWSIPKGLMEEGEDPRTTALREFREETGLEPPPGELLDLGEVRQKGGKVVHGFAVEGDLDLSGFTSNRVAMEWPRGSGQMQSFPEIDDLRYASLEEARRLLLEAQTAFLDRAAAGLGRSSDR